MASSAKEAMGAEREEEDSNSESSKPEEDDKLPHRVVTKKGSDTSTSTTNDPSSTTTSATATVVVRRPANQSELSTTNAAAKAPPVPLTAKKPRRATFREPFQITSATATVVTGQPTCQSAGLPSFAAAAAAAAPPVPLRVKKPRKAGFREQFLQKLRVMLDRESQNESTIVQWSTDGNSFIIKDQTQFEANIIPAYFDNPIVFASFLSKIHRWGFNRVSSRQTGHCEFRSPTFKRLGADSALAAAADVADDSSNNAGGGASIQQQQQQQPNQATSSLLQQFFAQTNQLPPPDHPLSNQTGTIADLISHIQRQRSSQQPPSIPSQQSALNHLLNMDLNLHPFQQLQHQDPTLNLLKTALSILVGSETPSAQPYSPAPDQRNAIQALLSLYGMSSLAGTLSNSPPPPDISQHNNVAVQSLLMLIHRACEDERERRVQAVATQNAIIASIGQILGLAPGGTSSRMNVPLSNPTGMTVSVPNNITFQADHGSGFQANPIAAILQAARSMAGGQRGEVAHQTQIAADDNDDNINDDSNDDRGGRLSERKRDDDDNSPRKKKK